MSFDPIDPSVRFDIRAKLDALCACLRAKNWTCSLKNPFSHLYWLFEKGGNFDFPYQVCGPLTHSGQVDRFRQKGRVIFENDQLCIESFEGEFLEPLRKRILAEHTFVDREKITRPIRISMAPLDQGFGCTGGASVFLNMAGPLARPPSDEELVNIIRPVLNDLRPQLLELANVPALDALQAWVLRSTNLQLRNRMERLQLTSSSWQGEDVKELFDWIAKVIATDLIKPTDPNIKLISSTICRVAASNQQGVEIVGAYFLDGIQHLRSASIEHGVVYNVAHTGQMFYISDVQDYVSKWTDRTSQNPSLLRGYSTPLPRYVACHPETRSELAIPLMAQGKVVGVINVEANGVDAFDPQHVLTLFQFGSSVALSSRLVSLLGDSKVLAQLHEKINLARERKDVLTALLEACKSLDHGLPVIWDSESYQWMPPRYANPRRSNGFTKWIATNRAPLAIADTLVGESGKIEFQIFKRAPDSDGTFFRRRDVAADFEIKDVTEEIKSQVRNPETPVVTGIGFPIASSSKGDADAVLWIYCFREFSTLMEDTMWRISLLCESAAARLRELAERQASRLENLVAATDELLQTAFKSSTKDSLEQMCKLAAKLLRAESCAFFVHAKAGEKSLQMRASWCEVLGHGTAGLKTDFEEVGMTARIARMLADGNDPIRMDQAEYQKELRSLRLEEVPKSPHPHVKGGIYTSVLAVPLKRKGRLRGYLKFINKKGAASFDDVDAAVGRILSSKLSAIYESRLTFDALIALSQPEATLRQYNEKLLEHVAHLVLADRAELAVWDEDKRQLVYDVVFGGATSRVVGIGEEIPKESLIRTLWQSKGTALRNIPDVTKLPAGQYHPAHQDTVAEAAIRIDGESLPIGVVNVESFDAAIGFDVQDEQVLQLVVSTAASMQQQLRGERYFQRIVTETMTSPEPLRPALGHILENIHAVFGFEEGMIYLHEPAKNQMVCLACKSSIRTPQESEGFFHSLDEKKQSFVNHVFRKPPTEPYAFSAHPWEDSRVSTEGLEFFSIPRDTTLVGFQLRHGKQSLGAMVVWSRENAPPQPKHQQRLRVYAELAAAKIAMQSSIDQIEQSRHFYEGILQDLPVKVFRKNEKSIFEFVNTAFASGTKFTAEEVKGRNDYDLYARVDAERYIADDLAVMKKKDKISGKEPHGGTIVHRIKVPIIKASGVPVGVLGCFWDIKEEIEREDLVRVQLNHHVSNYLMYLDIALQRARKAPVPNFREFEDMLAKVRNLHSLVFRRNVETADLQSLVTQIAEAHLGLYQMGKDPKKIEFSIRVPSGDYSLKTKQCMPQVFAELIENSLKYAFNGLKSHEAGTITIVAEFLPAAEEVRWIYSDDGREYVPPDENIRTSTRRYGIMLVEKYVAILDGRKTIEMVDGKQQLVITHPRVPRI